MRLLTRNLGWKLLSLAIAVMLWIAVAREPELATSISVPIEFKNIPDDLDIGSNVPDRMQVEVRGPAGRLNRDNLGNAALVLDLSDAHAGERTYTVRASSLTLPSGVSFYRAVPSQITLRFDHSVMREVSIEPRYLKGPPEGYRVRAFSLNPPRVRIRGPEERVVQLAHVYTDPVDLSGVVSEADFRTHVNVGDPQVRIEAPGSVTLKVILEKTSAKDSQ